MPPPRRTGRRLLLAGAALVLVALMASAALGVWLSRSEAGTRWLLGQIPGLRVEQPAGSLFAGSFKARAVHYGGPAGQLGVQLDDLAWDDAQWSFSLFGPRWFSVQLGELSVRDARIDTGPRSADRLRQPQTLRLPFELQVRQLRAERVQVDQLEAVLGLSGSVHLSAANGARHEARVLAARWGHLQAEGQLGLSSDRPFRLEADAGLTAHDPLPWQARLSGKGPLASLDIEARLRGEPAAGRAAPPTLDAVVQVRPFEAWPLGKGTATTQALDLQSLWPSAPRTQLSGRALLRSRTAREPLTAELELDNAKPASLGQGGLPLHSLRLVLQSDPKEPRRLVLGPFDVQVADTQGAAGRWTGSGIWRDEHLDLQTRLVDLQPQRLDARLAPMRLTGPLALSIQGLPPPDPQAPAPAARWLEKLTLETSGSLEGHLGGAPHEVGLDFEAKGSAQEFELSSLRAHSGKARAELTASAKRGADQRWHLRSKGELSSFDPALWVAGPEGSPWRKGPHRLNARWDLDLTTGTAGWTGVQAWRGHGRAQIDDSRLAGVPFSGTLEYRQANPSASPAVPSAAPGASPASAALADPGPLPPPPQSARLRADLKLASAQLTLDGSGDWQGNGNQDRLQLRVLAPALAEWGPWASLHPALSHWVPRQGKADIQVDARGRWPATAIEARGSLADLQIGALALGSAQLEARLDRPRGHAGTLKLDASRVSWGDVRLATARADIRGTPESHRFELALSAPVQPPAILAQALGWKPAAGGQAQLNGTGRWADAAEGGRWEAQVEQLSAGRWDGSVAIGTDTSWLEARNARTEWAFGPDGSLREARLQPGQAVLGPLVLRWQEAAWRAAAAGGQPHWRLRAETDPLPVAPLLMRLRPAGAGALAWSGDLSLAGQVDVDAGTQWKASVEWKRVGGDLLFSDGGPPRPLGLSAAEWRLSAQNGSWRLTPRMSGRTLGQVAGELRVRTRPSDRWPDPRDPIDGELQADVPALDAWATWLPAGWRLLGQADAQLRIGGSFGAPVFNGHVQASRVGVRNVLQGVDLQDGQFRLALNGETAQLERLSIRGGEGSLTAEGQARLGAQPRLQLQAKASKLRVLGRIDRQLVLSGRVGWEAGIERSVIDGQLTADSGLFDLSRRDAPTLDDDVAVRRGNEPEGSADDRSGPAVAEPNGPARQTQLALAVDLGPRLRLRGRGLDTGLAGKLDLSTWAGRLMVHGAVHARDGTYAAYGQKLEIERGVISLAGPPDSARLDILALRPNTDVRVGVAITGRAIDPRVRLISEPEMAEADKLSWLVLGRAPSGLGRADTALLQRAALALWAGEGESPTTGVLRAIGLDELSIRAGDGDVKDTVVSVGKQLGRRWYVGYERSVNATSGTWQLIYRAAQRFTLRAQSGEDNSLDLIWTWRFGQAPKPSGAMVVPTSAAPAASAPAPAGSQLN